MYLYVQRKKIIECNFLLHNYSFRALFHKFISKKLFKKILNDSLVFEDTPFRIFCVFCDMFNFHYLLFLFLAFLSLELISLTHFTLAKLKNFENNISCQTQTDAQTDKKNLT